MASRVELEEAAAEAGLVVAMVRTNEELRRETQYTEVLAKIPLITLEKIGDSEPVPLKPSGNLPLEGIRAFGMGHVIAGGAIGRDLALYGADVLNIWRPNDSELDALAWDAQVGMRQTILDDSKEDRSKFHALAQARRCLLCQQAPGIPGAARPGRGGALRAEARTDSRVRSSCTVLVVPGRTGPASI